MLSKLGALEAADATEYLTSTINSYRMESEEAISIVDKLVAVDNIAATSSRELATALRYVAAVAAESGVSLEQLISYIGVMSSVTRLNAEQIGQSLKTIFTRMQDIRAGKLDEDGMGINNVAIALKRINVDLMESETEFKDLSVVLEEVSAKWDTLNEVEQANIAKAIAGVRQQNMFRVLMQNMGTALEYQKAQYDAAGLAADRYQIYLKSVEAAQNKLKASMEGLYQDAIQDGLIVGFYDSARAIVEFIDKIGGLKTALALLTTAFIVYNLVTIKVTLPSIPALTLAFSALTARTMSLSGALGMLGVSAATTQAIISGGLTLVITALVGALIWFSQAEERAEKSVLKSTKALKEQYATINTFKSNSKVGKSLADELDELYAKGDNKTLEDQERILEIQNRLKDMFPELSGQRDDELNFLLDAKTYRQEILDIEEARLAILKEETKEAAKQSFQDNLKLLKIKKQEIDAKKADIARGGTVSEGHFRLFTPEQTKQAKTDLDSLEQDYNTTIRSMTKTAGEFDAEFQAEMIRDVVDNIKNAEDVIRAELLNAMSEKYKDSAELSYWIGLSKRKGEEPEKKEPVFHDYSFQNTESELEKMKDMREGYESLSKAVNDFGAGSAEAKEALFEVVGADDWDKYLENGKVNLEKYADDNKKIVDDLLEYLKEEGISVSEEEARALEDIANQTKSAMTQIMYEVGETTLNADQFAKYVDSMSSVLFDAASDTNHAFADMYGTALTSSEMIKQALMSGRLTFSQFVEQLAKMDIESLNKVSAYSNAVLANLTGASPYTPTAPTFGGGGGGGGGGGENPEKKAIEETIKSLEKKKDSLNDLLDEYKDYIDNQKELLKLQKEEKQFTDDMLKKQMSLAKIKARIALLALDDSEEARAQRLQLEEEAAELETEITEDSEDRKYDLKVQALEDAQKAFEDNIKKQIEGIESSIEAHREEINAINDASGAAGGYAGAMETVTETAREMAEKIVNGFKEIGKFTTTEKENLTKYIQKLIEAGMWGDELARKSHNAYIQTLQAAQAALELERISLGGRARPGVAYYHEGGIVESHHDGNFAGNLNTNEVFSKLLKGEYVATENQMKNFMEQILPSIARYPKVDGSGGGALKGDIVVNMPITIEGNMDSSIIPDLEKLTNKVIGKINNSLEIRGIRRTATSFSI